MNRIFPKLFERGQIGTLELNNRIIKAATHNALTAKDGSVTDRLIRFYEEQARGGAGLIIIQLSQVNIKEKPSRLLGVEHDQFISGLSALAQAIQDNGARACIQLAHLGSHAGVPPLKCVSPEIPPDELDIIKGLGGGELQQYTIEEIQELVMAYGDAAVRAKRAGFDMVEVHGAHQHGIAQFLSPRTNKRNDRYGGSPDNRMGILREIVADIRSKVGTDFPLGVRLSGTEYYPDGIMIDDTLEMARTLEKAGVDVIHVSGGVAYGPAGHHTACPMAIAVGHHIWAAEAVKKVLHIPVVASGSIISPDMAEEILTKGKADFVSLARILFADPHWPQKAREGRPEDITPCIRCNDGCGRRSGQQGRILTCSVNVTLGKETRLPIIPAEQHKKVVIVGGGPGGMEAARVCTLRGHKVILYEKRKLGGTLIEASVPEFKSDIRRLITYLATQMNKLNVEVIQKEATASMIKDGKFDAVIVAVGANIMKPDIPGASNPITTNVIEVLQGKAKLGQKVYIVGGGVVAVEVGLFLAEQGKEIIFTTRQDELMKDAVSFDRLTYKEMLAKQKVTVYTNRRLDTILNKGAVVVDTRGSRQEISADSIVLASGFIPQTALRDQLEKEPGLDVYAIGDCVKPRRIYDAIHEGHLAATKV